MIVAYQASSTSQIVDVQVLCVLFNSSLTPVSRDFKVPHFQCNGYV